MNIRNLGISAAIALGVMASPAASAEKNVNNSSGKAPAADVSPAAITVASASQHFIAVTPCRAFRGQPVATNTFLSYSIAGPVDMSPVGGSATGCGVPTYATAVTMNLSAGVSQGSGFLSLWATGTPRPNLATVSYNLDPATSGTVVSLGTGGKVSVFASVGTRVTGDVTGYFIPAVLSASIFANGTVNRGEGVDVAATASLGTGTYQVGFTRDITECFFQATAGEGGVGGAQPRITGITRRSGNPNGVFVRIINDTGASVDNDFFVTVDCGK
ncbi:hypothetical protein IHQ68_13450 [Chelatococcus sambhunathii]|uniref:Uncharacterized protein n=1 Tax=Chelatococcus sambhunathii TaxID=363953 RepID=A0ABU1DI96_9HYPH|nr:hypothetical protein [Chelatococcus sambhunathii]MDR4307625.1 hypothetical protein [Chelatococcus sambhunathii]